jgi:hypothetical protein
MNDLILTQEKMFTRRVENNDGIKVGLYFDGTKKGKESFGDVVRNSKGERFETMVTADKGRWVNSAGYHKLWNQIEDVMRRMKPAVERTMNVATLPDDYYTLINLFQLDITRQRMEQQDFTGLFSQEITNPAFSKSVALLEFVPFAGAFLKNSGNDEQVPLIDQKTGAKGSVPIELYALGHKRTLMDELFNLDIFTLQKVASAVARAHTALRNDLSIGQLVAHSVAADWDASQAVEAVDHSASYDENLYDTFNVAVRTLGNLLDWQTRNAIGIQNAVLIVGNEVDAWAINRVIRGNLAIGNDGAGATIKNVGPLPIGEIWVYKGDRIIVGKTEYNYPGVPEGVAYLIIPAAGNAPNYTLVKRQLTQEVGRGSVLSLSREERAWYFAQGVYSDEFFGSTGGLGTAGDGFGYCVEITLPEMET